MKGLLLFLLLLVGGASEAATVYACACGTGSHVNCQPGTETSPYDTPAKAINTMVTWKIAFQALAAGDHLSTCQGGAFNGVATGNMANTNGTAANPVVIDSYDDSARWSGGAGTRPKFNNTSAAIALSFNKATMSHTEGLTIKDIEVVGDGVNTTQNIFIAADTDYIIIDNVKTSGGLNGIQITGVTAGTYGSGDSKTNHVIIRNSDIRSNRDNGILISSSDVLIENNTFTLNGNAVTDHHVYITGNTGIFSSTISSITGNGTTATLTTTSPHGIATGSHLTISVTGTTSSGSGSFNSTGGINGNVATVTGPSTITYAATGTPSASVVGAYVATIDVPTTNVTIRNNTMTEANVGGAGLCGEAAIVVHGDVTGLLIEGNTITESAVPANGSCTGIEIDTGDYQAPEDYEGFANVVVRNNTVLNNSVGIAVDLARAVLIENNYVYSTYAGFDAMGVRMRGKNFVPGTIGSSTIGATQRSPDNVTIRYNTVYLTAPKGSSWGITLNGNVGDPLTGTNHNLYGNVVVFGTSATTATMCFNTANMTAAMFSVKDYNACYYLGASVPKWENTDALATIQALGQDTHSIFGATTSVTADQPFFTAPASSAAISTSSALKNAGHPTLGPSSAWGGLKRDQSTRDIGAYEFGATNVIPGSPTKP